jgi:hypothetical protein
MFAANNVHGRHVLSQDTFQIYRCNNCGIIFIGSVEINSEYYLKYYSDRYYNKDLNKPTKNILNLITVISTKIKERDIEIF